MGKTEGQDDDCHQITYSSSPLVPCEAAECLCAPVGQIIWNLDKDEEQEIEEEYAGEWSPHCLLLESFKGTRIRGLSWK